MDEFFIKRTIELAQQNVTLGDGGPFGAVVVRGKEIVAEGRNRVVATRDATAHAEIVAIREASRRLGHFHLPDCTLYASSEPCPMCLAAAYWARISRIVFANSRQQAAAIGFCDDDLYCELSQPLPARRIPTCHLPIAGAEAPLRLWLAHPGRIHY